MMFLYRVPLWFAGEMNGTAMSHHSLRPACFCTRPWTSSKARLSNARPRLRCDEHLGRACGGR